MKKVIRVWEVCATVDESKSNVSSAFQSRLLFMDLLVIYLQYRLIHPFKIFLNEDRSLATQRIHLTLRTTIT